MKSICIKTNNENLLDYLLNELDYIEVKPVAISKNQFKNYKNNSNGIKRKNRYNSSWRSFYF